MSTDDLYRRLQRHLDRMPVPFPATESGVELRILRALFSPEEAAIALALNLIPETASVISRRVRPARSRRATPPHAADQSHIAGTLETMAKKGLILAMPGPNGVRYGKTVFVVGFYEAQVNRLTKAFERDVLQYFDEAFGDALASLRTPQMRTVPVNMPLAAPDRAVARYDDMFEVVRSSKGPFAAMNCICQQGKDLLDEPCRVGSRREHCLMLGPAAEFTVERGAARYVTREEMLGLLEQADRDGLVLQPQNTEDPLFVCCCCGCCCGVLTLAKKLPKPAEYVNANYFAQVADDDCHQCGTCIDRCQMGAISVGPAMPGVQVDRNRCIGCGLCVSTCTTGAMHLVAREEPRVPPRDTGALYQRMFKDRYGVRGIAEVVFRKAVGRPF